mmetsp:Transcript_40944/g.74011  ORF Transcript_40944/g.74011 Transcript_40944/m.74011 type:complete len:199 (+) Transcript_40944:54-650(+)
MDPHWLFEQQDLEELSESEDEQPRLTKAKALEYYDKVDEDELDRLEAEELRRKIRFMFSKAKFMKLVRRILSVELKGKFNITKEACLLAQEALEVYLLGCVGDAVRVLRQVRRRKTLGVDHLKLSQKLNKAHEATKYLRRRRKRQVAVFKRARHHRILKEQRRRLRRRAKKAKVKAADAECLDEENKWDEESSVTESP